MRTKLILLLVTLLFFSCETEITDLKVTSESAKIIVYGELNNLDKPFVRLTKSTKYQPYDINEFVGEPITGASVTIISENNSLISLTEIRDGYYEAISGYHLVENENYKVVIETNGLIIESESEVLHTAPHVEDILATFKDAEKVENMRFELSTSIGDSKESNNFYFIKRQDYIQFLTTCPDPPPPPATSPICFNKCWRAPLNTQPALISDFLVNGANLEIPLKSITLEDFAKWAIELDVFSVSKSVYTYWKNQEEQREIGGGLFDKIPYQIKGNLSCINDSQLQILGVFMVSGKTQEKITVDRFSDVPLEVYKKIEIYANFNEIRYPYYQIWDCKDAGFVPYNIGHNLP